MCFLIFLLESSDVAKSKVDDMDVVADTSTIRGVVVVSKDVDKGKGADSDAGNVRHEVVGDAAGVLADEARLVCADGVKVAEEDDRGAGVCDVPVAEDVFDEEFGPAVGVCAGEREGLVDGDGLGDAIDGGGGREDDAPNLVALHALEEDERTRYVVLVIFQRYFNALPDSLQPCKVDDAVDGGVFVKDFVQRGFVGDVHVVKMAHHVFACDLLGTPQALLAAVAEVVHHHHVMPCVQKLDDRVAPDEPCPSCHQYCVLFAHCEYMCKRRCMCVCVLVFV